MESIYHNNRKSQFISLHTCRARCSSSSGLPGSDVAGRPHRRGRPRSAAARATGSTGSAAGTAGRPAAPAARAPWDGRGRLQKKVYMRAMGLKTCGNKGLKLVQSCSDLWFTNYCNKMSHPNIWVHPMIHVHAPQAW